MSISKTPSLWGFLQGRKKRMRGRQLTVRKMEISSPLNSGKKKRLQT